MRMWHGREGLAKMPVRTLPSRQNAIHNRPGGVTYRNPNRTIGRSQETRVSRAPLGIRWGSENRELKRHVVVCLSHAMGLSLFYGEFRGFNEFTILTTLNPQLQFFVMPFPHLDISRLTYRSHLSKQKRFVKDFSFHSRNHQCGSNLPCHILSGSWGCGRRWKQPSDQ